MTDLFDGYVHEGFFDEVFDRGGRVRPHYRALVQRLAELTPTELVRRERLPDDAFRNQDITFTVYGEEARLPGAPSAPSPWTSFPGASRTPSGPRSNGG